MISCIVILNSTYPSMTHDERFYHVLNGFLFFHFKKRFNVFYLYFSSNVFNVHISLYIAWSVLTNELHLWCTSCTGIYYCCNMIMVALTSVVSVVIIYVSDHYQNQPVPHWARKVCNRRKITSIETPDPPPFPLPSTSFSPRSEPETYQHHLEL